jgi:hypothetical protein
MTRSLLIIAFAVSLFALAPTALAAYQTNPGASCTTNSDCIGTNLTCRTAQGMPADIKICAQTDANDIACTTSNKAGTSCTPSSGGAGTCQPVAGTIYFYCQPTAASFVYTLIDQNLCSTAPYGFTATWLGGSSGCLVGSVCVMSIHPPVCRLKPRLMLIIRTLAPVIRPAGIPAPQIQTTLL